MVNSLEGRQLEPSGRLKELGDYWYSSGRRAMGFFQLGGGSDYRVR